MEYELVALDCRPLATAELVKHAAEWLRAPGANGHLLGAYRTEIGALGRLVLLRGFDDAEQARAERARTLESAAPFGGDRIVTTYEQRSYRRLPFLPARLGAAEDAVYEIRSYDLRAGGLPPTIAAWQSAIEPAAAYTRHLVTCLYATDGAPRLTHIWGFDSLEQRMELRAAHYKAGTWPPKGAPEQILTASSAIAFGVPEMYSV